MENIEKLTTKKSRISSGLRIKELGPLNMKPQAMILSRASKKNKKVKMVSMASNAKARVGVSGF